jgi:ubiquinone/menaquinone biosynthesis C-methylase UbiE
MTRGGDDYIHGTDPVEQRRLSRLNQFVNQASLTRLAVRPGERVLDVGCGIGQLSRLMARAAGTSGCVVGEDRSPEQIAEGRRQAGADVDAIEIREGDAMALPLQATEWGTFDVVHTRFLLEHLAEPQAVVNAMVRAARPGGRIILEDDDHELLRLYPAVPAFEALWRAYLASYQSSGRDPLIGRRLPDMLAQAGAEPSRCDWPFFGACHGSEHWDLIVSNCRAILVGARAAIQAQGVSSNAFDTGLSDYDAWRETRGAAFWYCTFWAEGIRPVAGGV